MARLSPSVFKIPTDKIRSGYYTDRYFLRVRDVLRKTHRRVRIGYQFFPRQDAVVCGLDEAIAILKTCAGEYRDPDRADQLYVKLRNIQWELQKASVRQQGKRIFKWERERTKIRQRLNALWKMGWDNLQVFALNDGEPVKKNKPLLAIVGDPRLFVHLETTLLGAIARPTSTATAVARVVRAAKRKKVFFFSARFDHYWVQATDGYAALKAGAFGVSTDANADYWGVESIGTMPHFLIGCYGGDTAEACINYDRVIDARVNRIALVDWDNDCIGTTHKVLARLVQGYACVRRITPALFLKYAPKVVGSGKGKLWGVRFDTSGSLKDRSVKSKGKTSYGVCPELVWKARKEFDCWGCQKLKILVSGGFNEERIEHFEKLKVPVDGYGIGSSLFRKKVEITADVVECKSKRCAKVGRQKADWGQLRRVR